MKYIIASDLHGSAEHIEKLVEAFRREKGDFLILLGDILYHGPRNHLPEAYDTKEAAALLNELGEYIVCVRGNCDAEVDQAMLDFPVLSDSGFVVTEAGLRLFITHGHRYNPIEPPKLPAGAVMLSGHTHVPASFASEEGVWFLNPGSVSIPKNGSPHSYMTLEGNTFLWKTLAGGEVYRELTVE